MKTVKAKNRLERQATSSSYYKSRFQSNFSNRILFFTSLVPALILMSFASSFHLLAAKYLQYLRPYLVVLTLGNERT